MGEELKYIKRKIESKETGRISTRTNKLPKVDYDVDLKDFMAQIKVYPSNTRQALLQQFIKVKNAQKAMAETQKAGLSHTNLLSPIQKAEVIELFSRYFTVKEVWKIINEEWNIKYSMTSVANFKKSNMAVIEKKRIDYTSNISGIRLVHKRSRIEELSDLYQKAKDKGYIDTSVRILDQVNKEVEKNQLEIIHSGQVNINQNMKLTMDIGLENVKALALMKTIALLSPAQRARLHKKLVDTGSQTNLLNVNKAKVIKDGEEGSNVDEEMMQEAQYEDISQQTVNVKTEDETVKKELNKSTDKISNIEKLKLLMRKKVKSRVAQIDNIDTEVSKREIENRGDEV